MTNTKTKSFKIKGQTYTVTLDVKDKGWQLTIDGQEKPVAVGMFNHGMLDTEDALTIRVSEKVENILLWMTGDVNTDLD